MEVRDPIHGAIDVRATEIPVVDSLFFQRLRNLKQLGFAELSFPGATHNRYLHSLGVMHVATRAFDQIFKNYSFSDSSKRERFLQTVRLAALLHDVGHGPYSHSSEIAMPDLKELNLNFLDIGKSERQANHEDYTLKIILESSLTESLKRAQDNFGIKPEHVASLVAGVNSEPGIFEDAGIDFSPLLHQIVSSEIDADRMDYLIRDSYYCGVSYGSYDFDWLVSNLTFAEVDKKAYLAVDSRAIYSFDDFLLSRYHMFLMVYFHYKSVIFEEMLNRYFKESKDEFIFPTSPEGYLQCDDGKIFGTLRDSSNFWAQRIVKRNPFKLVHETHLSSEGSGSKNTDEKADEIEKDLKDRGVPFIRNNSTGALSKYYLPDSASKGFRIFVKSHGNGDITPIEQVTDLFKKYSEKRSITRIYADREFLNKS